MKFYDQPPEAEMLKPLPLIRPQAGKPLNTIIQSETWAGVYTHWWGGKTVQCGADNCRACERNIARLWKGFVVVADSFNTDNIAVLQFTGRCCRTLIEHKRDCSGVLGARVLWTRIGKQRNSPLRCEVMGWAHVESPYGHSRLCDVVSAIFRDTGHFDQPA